MNTENQTEDTNELPQVDELTALKARADLLGISYHPSIKVESLKAKINAKLTDQPDPEAAFEAPILVKGDAAKSAVETETERRIRLKREANKLVRVNITCMNPAKKEWDGEIFTTGNGVVGTFKKFVPFNTEDGWHVPAIILEMIKERKCQIFYTDKKSSKNGVPVRKGKLIKEFSIDYLDPLTDVDLKELAQRQLMASGSAV